MVKILKNALKNFLNWYYLEIKKIKKRKNLTITITIDMIWNITNDNKEQATDIHENLETSMTICSKSNNENHPKIVI